MTGRRKKRPAMPGAGRPARAGGEPSASRTVRLSREERELLAALAARLGVSESDVLRRGLVALEEALRESRESTAPKTKASEEA